MITAWHGHTGPAAVRLSGVIALVIWWQDVQEDDGLSQAQRSKLKKKQLDLKESKVSKLKSKGGDEDSDNSDDAGGIDYSTFAPVW